MLDDGVRPDVTRQEAVMISKMPGSRHEVAMKKRVARMCPRNAATEQHISSPTNGG
jgi:hypothetical protein